MLQYMYLKDKTPLKLLIFGQKKDKTADYLRQWSPTCLAPGTAFVADNFSLAGVGGGRF